MTLSNDQKIQGISKCVNEFNFITQNNFYLEITNAYDQYDWVWSDGHYAAD